MFVADRTDEVLHVIVAFARVGTLYLQIATWFRFIDLSKLPLGFLVVEHLGCQNHVTRFGVEEIAVLVRRILHCQAKLFEVHRDLTSGLLVVHLRNSCMTSSDKPQSAPHLESIYNPTPPMGAHFTCERIVLRTRAMAFFRPASRGSEILATTAVIGVRWPRQPSMSLNNASSLRGRARSTRNCSAAWRSAGSRTLTTTRPARWIPWNRSETAHCPTGLGGGPLRTCAIPASITERASSARRGFLRT